MNIFSDFDSFVATSLSAKARQIQINRSLKEEREHKEYDILWHEALARGKKADSELSNYRRQSTIIYYINLFMQVIELFILIFIAWKIMK